MGLENLKPAPGSKTEGTRKGRGPGSGKGKTAGRGHKGQKARSGGQIPAWFEGGQMPLYRRLPKFGFTPHTHTEYEVVNLDQLDRFEEDEIDLEALEEAGLSDGDRPVKILARGDVDRALTVRAHAFSDSAREKIEDAGGSVEVIE
ncbi:MAG: 50S ribosomal protein L15 [Gemmatimonadota bacterium]